MSKGKWKKSLNTVLSVGLVTSLVIPTLSTPATAASNATDLIISEYVEGSSFNKALELYNGTGETIDLSAYTLELYANGSANVTQKLTLSGSLAAFDTYVIYHGSASAEIASKGNLSNSSVINFNGDDAIVLKKSGEIIDSFGQVGHDPGTSWGTDVKTVDMTLVRNGSITTGDKKIDDTFDPAAEWIAHPKDTFVHLGSHEFGGTAPEEPENPTDVISIADSRARTIGSTVTIKGVVAANLKNTISVQDATGGIAVRPASLDVKIGDEVTLTGTLADYRGLLQLDGATIVAKTEAVGAPKALEITGAEVIEENESELVTVKQIEIIDVQDGGAWANYRVTDGTTEFIVRDETNELGLVVGNTYDSITGIVQQFDSAYQVIPRSVQDIVVDSSVVQPVYANPGSGTFVDKTVVTLSTSTTNAEILYTVDGTDPIENGKPYTAPINITKNTTIKAVAKTGDGLTSDVKTFEYTITDSLDIHDIQGAGHTSPFAGQSVENVEGVVTYTFQLNGSTYYHIQTPG